MNEKMDGYTCISGNIGIIANSVIDMEGQLRCLGILGNEDVFCRVHYLHLTYCLKFHLDFER